MVNSGGRVRNATRRMTGVMRSVEMMSCSFRAGSISSPRFTLQKLVAKKVVMRHTKIPAALTKRGKSMAVRLCVSPMEDREEMTRAAQVDSAKEPKRSLPIPAMSPTLSPTWSAMTCEKQSERPVTHRHMSGEVSEVREK